MPSTEPNAQDNQNGARRDQPGSPQETAQEVEDYRHQQNLRGNQTVPEQEYQDYALEYSDGGATDRQIPDVLLDVPVVKVDEIDLEVQDLRARVSLQAEVLDLVKLNVGVDAGLGTVKLTIKGVEAQALLKVRLDNVTAILDRVLTTIDRNPDIIRELTKGVRAAVEDVGQGAGQATQQIGRGAGRATEEVGAGAERAVEDVGQGAGQATEEAGRGVGQAAEEVGQGAGQATQQVGEGAGQATQQVGQGAGQAAAGAFSQVQGLVSETLNQAGQVVQRSVDESGNVLVTTLDESGNVLEEDVAGNLGSLPVEQEHQNDQGQTVRRLRDESGSLIDQTLDSQGNTVRLDAVEG